MSSHASGRGRRRPRNRALLAIVGVLSLALAACSDSDQADGEAEIEAEVEGNALDLALANGTTQPLNETVLLKTLETTEPGSANFDGSMAITPIGGTDAVDVTFTGSYEMASEASSVLADLNPLADEAAAFGLGGLESGLFAGDPIQIVIVEDKTYATGGALSLFASGSWVVLEPPETDAVLSGFGLDSRAVSPLELFDQLGEADATISEVGDDSIEGLPVRHVRAMVDPADLGPGSGSDSGDGAANDSPETVPVDFWVGEDGEVYRMTLDLISASASESEGAESVVVLVDFLDHGDGATVAEPVAADTIKLAELLPGVGS